MSSRRLLRCIEYKEKGGREFLEAHHRMPDGKLIAKVQVCLRCGRLFPFKRVRNRCPRCFGPIKTKMIVVETP